MNEFTAKFKKKIKKKRKCVNSKIPIVTIVGHQNQRILYTMNGGREKIKRERD